MLFALFYVIAIVILVLHFTGFLARHNLEWLVLVLAGAGQAASAPSPLPTVSGVLAGLAAPGATTVIERDRCGSVRYQKRLAKPAPSISAA